MDDHESVRISTRADDVDTKLVVREILNSYWGKDRSEKMILHSIKNSLCFSLFVDQEQVAFLRVITDYSTFAYLCDVFVVKEHRGKGYSKKLLGALFHHPELLDVKWLLRTKDAHTLYEKFGFEKTFRAERYMEKL
ncbi:MAG: GNAT family N-acetyltransferase [Bacteriovorax sp.]